MAPPVDFKPKPLELRSAFLEELERAPQVHTQALLNLYALLGEAHEGGWLDAARGAIAGTPVAVAEAAKYANTREGVAMMRNLISLGKILASIDPEVLHSLSNEIARRRTAESKRTSLLALARSVFRPEVLRGAAFALGAVALLGQALAKRR